MKIFRIAALLLLAGAPALAQTVTLSASSTYDGNSLANGIIHLAPVLSTGQSASYQRPGGGTASVTPMSATVTNGAFSLTVPDTYLTTPQNLCFKATLTTQNGSVLGAGYNCLQPGTNPTQTHWCTTVSNVTTCNFDKFTPLLSPQPTTSYVQSVNGCTGVCTVSGSGTGNVNNTGTPASAQLAQWISATVIQGVTASGDCTIALGGVITCTKSSGTAFGSAAFDAASAFDASGAAATAQSNAEAYSANASNISSGTLAHARLPALLSADIPNNAANTSGNAATATAFAATPTGCPGGEYATGMAANGNLTCGTPSGSGTVSGQAAGVIPLGTSPNAISNQSHMDDGKTTTGVITSTEPIAVAGPPWGSKYPAGTCLAAAAGYAVICADPTIGNFEVSNNGAALSLVCTVANGGANCPALTAANMSTNGTANQVWAMNGGATAQGWTTPSGGGSTTWPPSASGPTFSPAAGAISSGTTVTDTCPGSSTPYISLGTTPVAGGTGISVTSPETLYGLCTGSGYFTSGSAAYTISGGGFSLVQPKSSNTLTSAGCGNYASTVTCPMPINVTAGNALYIYLAFTQTSGTFGAPAKSSGTATIGTCTAIGSGSTAGGAQAWYTCSVTGSGSLTLSETASATNNLVMLPFEITGGTGVDSGTNPVYTNNTCYSTSCSNVSITTVTSGDIVLNAIAGSSSITYSAITPYTAAGTSAAAANNVDYYIGYYTAASAGAVNGTFTTNATAAYQQGILAIK